MNSQLLCERFTEEQPPTPHPIITSVSCRRITNTIRSVVRSEIVGQMRHYQSGQLQTMKSMVLESRPKDRLHGNEKQDSVENCLEKKEAGFFNDPVTRKLEADSKQAVSAQRYRYVNNSIRNKQNNEALASIESPTRQITVRKVSYQKREPEEKLTGITTTKRFEPEEAVRIINKDVVRYEDMHEKLNTLETKFASMRAMLASKREDRRLFLQAQQKQRAEIEFFRAERQQRRREEQQRRSGQRVLKPTGPSKQILKAVVTQVKEVKDLKYMDHNPYNAADKTYYVSEVVSTYKDAKSAARQHIMHSIKSLKAMQNCRKRTLVDLLPKSVSLSKKEYYRDKKTVVFDLDETLVHCNESLELPHDIRIPIRFPNGESTEAGVNIRPYARELLQNLSVDFEIIVFTASHACYANVVLDYLDPERKYIEHRLFREHCYEGSEGMYVKDLRILNRSLNSIVLVDNAAYSFCFQLDNAIPIVPYYSGERDFELCALEKYIQSLAGLRDVREQNRRTFKLDRYTCFDDPERLVEALYL